MHGSRVRKPVPPPILYAMLESEPLGGLGKLVHIDHHLVYISCQSIDSGAVCQQQDDQHTARRPSVVDWGLVCLLAASAGPESRYAGYGRCLTCAVPVPISHHFHDCKAPLAHASHVKWRYTKYLGF